MNYLNELMTNKTVRLRQSVWVRTFIIRCVYCLTLRNEQLPGVVIINHRQLNPREQITDH